MFAALEPTDEALEDAIVIHPASYATAETGVLRFNHTIEEGEGRLLLVSSHTVSVTYTTASVAFAGTELRQEGAEIKIDIESGPGEDCSSSLWYLVDPPVGTFEIVATLEQDTKRMASWAMSFSGVDTTTPIRNLTAATSEVLVDAASLTVSSRSGELVIDGICFGQPFPADLVAAEGQTERLKDVSIDNSLQVAASSKPGGRPHSMSWTHDPGPHTHYSVVLRPAP